MWHWFERLPREILLDIDKPTERRIASVTARLGGAMRAGKLEVERWFLLPSDTKENVHAVVSLFEPIGDVWAVAWELYLLSDRHRATMNLFRAVGGHPWPSVLIEPYPVPYWRPADSVCSCQSKHDAETMARCPVGAELGRVPSSAFVGEADRENWRAVLAAGILPAWKEAAWSDEA